MIWDDNERIVSTEGGAATMRHLAKPQRRLASTLIAACLTIGFSRYAAADDSFSADQKTTIQSMIQAYILSHPEVVMQALQISQNEQQKREAASREDAIASNASALFDDPDTAVIGNPRGSVTMVEFADFQCGYCKAMEPVIHDLMAKDHGLRVVVKDLPILGPTSDFAARVGLVAAKNGRYAQFRTAILAQPSPLDTQEVWKAASIADLNAEQVKKEVSQPWVNTELAEDMKLATSLSINGTPAFVIGDTLILGSVSQSDLENVLRARDH